MTNKVTQNSIRTMIETIAGAEKVTKAGLATLSRDLLNFVFVQGNDTIELVNELLVVLTPMNRTTASAFFKHHLPWGYNPELNLFEKKFDAGKRTDKKMEATKELLADPASNIWTWATKNLEVQFNVPNYTKLITNAVGNAIAGKKNPDTGEHEGAIEAIQVIRAVMAGGIKGEDIIDMFDKILEDDKNAQLLEEDKKAKAA